jgi:hypothetical protein
MAVSLDKLRGLTNAELKDLAEKLELELRMSWAVYAEHDPDTGELKVVKIIPWAERDEDTNPVKITDAPDEMAAYTKFMGPNI